jgi:LPS-assembly lipoprotein
MWSFDALAAAARNAARLRPRLTTLGPRLRGDGHSARRSVIARLGALALSGQLAACGFRLRGTQQLPFETVYIDAAMNSALGIELARNIRAGTSTRLAADRASAQGVIEVVSEERSRDVLSVNAQGRAVEYRLWLRVTFRVREGIGRELIGPTKIAASRDLAISEAQILARESEEAQLYADMQIDLVQQILRRLSVLKP